MVSRSNEYHAASAGYLPREYLPRKFKILGGVHRALLGAYRFHRQAKLLRRRKHRAVLRHLAEFRALYPAAAEKLAQKRQKQNESAKAAYNHLKEQAKTDPEAAKKLEERRSKQRKATNKYLEKRKNNVLEDYAVFIPLKNASMTNPTVWTTLLSMTAICRI